MTIFGWIFMGVSWILIIGLFVFCYCRVFMKKEGEPQ